MHVRDDGTDLRLKIAPYSMWRGGGEHDHWGRQIAMNVLDENAAAHMAFGSGFAKTRTVPITQRRHGVNRSKTHIDVMIGTDALDADGITQSGKRVPLVSDGAWQF